MDGSAREVSVSEAAKDCLRKADNDIASAQGLLARMVLGHGPLFRSLMEPLVETACYDALRAVVRGNRDQIWTAPNYTKAGNGGRLESLGITLLDFPLPGGLALKLAHKDDLIDAARFYATQATDMAHKAKWLDAIAAKVGTKTVGEKFTAEKLQALQEATK